MEQWNIHSNAGHVRKRILERDKGICAQCGFDAHTAQTLLQKALREDANANGNRGYVRRGWMTALPMHWLKEERWMYQFPRYHALADQLQIPMKRRNIQTSALWEADHIIPVCEGGGCCDLYGYRTLCWRCHLKETANLNARRTARRGGWCQEIADSLVDPA